ncbi:hypothetical protein GLOIN_2v1567819 [Rhizophagus irregularis DAOM 181602=DAOM 197198]|uniref:Uncharacterized protein n=1 Tax=Rhizophagus irregularis (strain DAOM 181602 / DAOM 197198 / MUCL 43194) TaxID=747089 RepID=A0A2P4QC71_RHIID|nr:hypothetical protein GLOIN_2v1567819 [Rhizophagus irregularis DAOM 181602=DAOM 197198]POG75214.1 hypothetical protein GLOIN_2v1567819 [Rhizophagus irregularis DAOM 181602=DAOM 197198]GET55898.1 hypothetical protein GLOIN_2v1567819 [Rhizophagus irregularis DAOM 181602=DAOM 197198]|eukprot:XP_025182080.1 hypothetical protein GLOIN_2v1567819 [Rhizophagus irregularis DAOM 181602=DAOM 197198]
MIERMSEKENLKDKSLTKLELELKRQIFKQNQIFSNITKIFKMSYQMCANFINTPYNNIPLDKCHPY